jgi:hypothetical protein
MVGREKELSRITWPYGERKKGIERINVNVLLLLKSSSHIENWGSLFSLVQCHDMSV